MVSSVSSEHPFPSLSSLESISYIDAKGLLPEQFAGKVGLYAIFDEAQTLQFVGYSRDIVLSLKQHLVRCPHQCIWLKVNTVERPNRTLLEQIKTHWIEEQGTMPPGNDQQEDQWTQPIDAKALMTAEEKGAIATVHTDFERSKLLKKVARRIEADILATLESRGLRTPLRFDPKMKEQGLLNIKPE